ncbi:MAG TPA: T9SS type A sorting domain-containing protein [Bacteroides sp.]|nr:T9SS type A sorting domain-containing protein [Bacteroides sp.]
MIVSRNKKGIIILFFLCIWIIKPALSLGSGDDTGKRPNLLIIMTDQQRFDALSYAGNTILKTPNMDRIANEGVWFKNAHTPCAVCVPARASIFTGHTVENTRVVNNGAAYDTKTPGIMTMKTYDGKIYNNAVTATKTTELGPSMRKDYLNFLDPLLPVRNLQEGEFYDTYTLRADLASRGKDTSENPGQGDIHGITSIPADYHVSAHEAGETLKALERLKDSTFSLTCSFHHPQPPFLAVEEYVNMFPPDSMPLPESINDDMSNSPYKFIKDNLSPLYSDPEKIKYFISEYYALVKEIDDRVGAILDKLDNLGLTENTLVIFMSDHGEMMGAHGMRSKNMFYEESSHIPLMIRFPGRIEPGIKVDSYISLTNVFATIFDYLEMPEQASDGFSLRGLIEGTDKKNGKYLVTEWLSSLKTKPSHMVLKEGWKLMIPDSSSTKVMKALYNLNEDPYEMNNLLGNNPEAYKYESKVAELEYCFIEWLMKSRGIPLPTSGIGLSQYDKEVRVYPNPASGRISIRVAEAQLPANIELLSMDGRLVLKERIYSEYTSLNIQDLIPGMYFHTITDADRFVNTGKLWIK